MALIHVQVPQQMYEALERLQQQGLFSSFSEIGREATRRLLKEHQGEERGT